MAKAGINPITIPNGTTRRAFGSVFAAAAAAVAISTTQGDDAPLLRLIAEFTVQDAALCRAAALSTDDDEADEEALRAENTKWWNLLDSILPLPAHTLAGVKAKAALWPLMAAKLSLDEDSDGGGDAEYVWARSLATDIARLEG